MAESSSFNVTRQIAREDILNNHNISDLHLTLGSIPVIQCLSVRRNIADRKHWVRHHHFPNVQYQCHDQFPLPKIPCQMNRSQNLNQLVSLPLELKVFHLCVQLSFFG